MILEIATLNVKVGQESQFEAAFATARRLIASMPGHLGHDLQRCVENPNQYVLLVRWRTLEDHTVGFRGSPAYQAWRQALHHFYDDVSVQHYDTVLSHEAV